jgi:hypothetical protein
VTSQVAQYLDKHRGHSRNAILVVVAYLRGLVSPLIIALSSLICSPLQGCPGLHQCNHSNPDHYYVQKESITIFFFTNPTLFFLFFPFLFLCFLLFAFPLYSSLSFPFHCIFLSFFFSFFFFSLVVKSPLLKAGVLRGVVSMRRRYPLLLLRYSD